jgi:hypothetical protein
MPRHVVFAFLFIFLGKVRSKDDFRYLLHSLECVQMLLQFVVILSSSSLVRCGYRKPLIGFFTLTSSQHGVS